MLDNEPTGAAPTGDDLAAASTATSSDAPIGVPAAPAAEPAPKRPARRRAASRAAGPPTADAAPPIADAAPPEAIAVEVPVPPAGEPAVAEPEAAEAPRRRATRSRRRTPEPEPDVDAEAVPAEAAVVSPQLSDPTPPDVAVEVALEPAAPRARRRRRGAAAPEPEEAVVSEPAVAAEPERAVEPEGAEATVAPAEVEVEAEAPAVTESIEAAEPPAEGRRRRRRAVASLELSDQPEPLVPLVPEIVQIQADEVTEEEPPAGRTRSRVRRAPAPMITFMAPDPAAVPVRPIEPPAPPASPLPSLRSPGPLSDEAAEDEDAESAEDIEAEGDDETGEDGRRRRRRGRRGRGRGRGENGADEGPEGSDDEPGTDESAPAGEASEEADENDDAAETGEGEAGDGDDEQGTAGSRRRRRRRRRGAGDPEPTTDDPPNTVVRVRQPATAQPSAQAARSLDDEVQGVKGSTRLEAKRQRRREGRESNRRRPPVLSEAEFLARREAVNRVMVVRQIGDRTQIAALEDDVLVEHYVTKASSSAYAGNVYLGRVQNVLPSMEAAFVDIGKGRNAVLYAGEVNWDAAGMEGRPRKIEVALKSGDSVLVQVTKDPIGHKGARLTSQVSLPGRFLVYVPEGQMTGLSRKLPDTERKRLKDILKKIVPENAGVIIRTAAEGATEAELTHDVERLEAQWQVIKEKAAKGGAPILLDAEPDLVIRVIRDVFNEDFSKLVVSGTEAWPEVDRYVRDVSPDLAERLVHHTGDTDVFAAYRIDEQITKALDRKVWLPSGGSLVIDRTEAMTVVDVNTGKFTGQGGNLEETVTRNNLEAAEEIVRQLRLRDIGGIIVIDFIDMVLEGNRELVLRRLTECLGRDRTKHQVAEVTSLGLVQMTRKRVGQGLLEAFSETCEVCRGRGVILHTEPLIGRPSANHQHPAGSAAAEPEAALAPPTDVREGREGRNRRRKRGGGEAAGADLSSDEPTDLIAQPAVAAVAAIHAAATRTVALAPEEDSAEDLLVPGETAPEEVTADDAAAAEDAAEYAADMALKHGEDAAKYRVAAAEEATGEPLEVFDVVEPFFEPEPVSTPAPRRRARRAASRPAGPPEG